MAVIYFGNFESMTARNGLGMLMAAMGTFLYQRCTTHQPDSYSDSPPNKGPDEAPHPPLWEV